MQNLHPMDTLIQNLLVLKGQLLEGLVTDEEVRVKAIEEVALQLGEDVHDAKTNPSAQMCTVPGFEHLKMLDVKIWMLVEKNRAVELDDLARVHFVNAAMQNEPGELEALLLSRSSPGTTGDAARRSLEHT